MRKPLWFLTIFFLVLGLVFTLVCAVLGAWNAFSNPFQTLLSVYGLVLWNGVAGEEIFNNLRRIILW